MADQLKFIHSSDFHLDRPIEGLLEIPAHLKQKLANAPYQAAERVFDLAVNEKVNFVLLAGDICDLENGGPRAAAFLLSQLERLADKGIMVYWCGGTTDHPDRWPNAVKLPDNVVTFSGSLVERVTYQRNGKPLATIAGCGQTTKRRLPSDFYCEPDSPFTIALYHGDFDSTNLSSQNVRYWALGGIHQRKVLDKTDTVAIFPGTPQARNPREDGAHSCTIGRVDAEGRLRTHEVDVDSVRWITQSIKMSEQVKLDDLKNMLGDRCLQMRLEAPEQTCLVKWDISTTGDFNPDLRSTAWHDTIVGYLRNQYGQEGGVWTDELNIAPPPNLPTSWYEEDTILGDYLRAVGRFQSDDSIKLGLHEYIPADIQDEYLVGLSQLDSAERKRLLQRSALIGVEYLGVGDDREIE
ncbi:MAG TPA: DNA repair exonuclease [Pirellulaceae bacterium]|nr:DNA repair exonuclease [Pirellulaceae bacterium]HMO92453.1 DNA repair exonuclease [Pirellulaceae bacterium]HMP67877.1 DNA repair exonuclease [Pirellulaceae bacterium]